MAAVLERTEADVLPEAVLAAAAAGAPGSRPVWIETFAQDSNDRAEARFADGRTLVVKRARHAWARERFAASRAATRLLREAGIPAPEPLPVPEPAGALPVEAYWKIELPTLAEVWAGAGGVERGRLLRGWGALLRRIHAIRLPAHGALLAPHPGGLAGYARSDLRDRLLPAVAGTWPQATAVVATLADAAGPMAARLAGTPAVLVHNDLHSANVLCDTDARDCVGALDLEAAFAGPAEADIAHVEVLHGPLFGKPLPDGWRDELHRGYGQRLDPQAIAFFRAFHLLNLGYHAAFCGHAAHAADVLAAAETEVRELRRSRRPVRITRLARPSRVQVCGGGTAAVCACAISSHPRGRPGSSAQLPVRCGRRVRVGGEPLPTQGIPPAPRLGPADGSRRAASALSRPGGRWRDPCPRRDVMRPFAVPGPRARGAGDGAGRNPGRTAMETPGDDAGDDGAEARGGCGTRRRARHQRPHPGAPMRRRLDRDSEPDGVSPASANHWQAIGSAAVAACAGAILLLALPADAAPWLMAAMAALAVSLAAARRLRDSPPGGDEVRAAGVPALRIVPPPPPRSGRTAAQAGPAWQAEHPGRRGER